MGRGEYRSDELLPGNKGRGLVSYLSLLRQLSLLNRQKLIFGRPLVVQRL